MSNKWFVYLLVILASLQIGGTIQAQTEPDGVLFSLPTDQIIIEFSAEATGRRMGTAVLENQLEQLSETAGMTLAYQRAMSGNAHVLSLPTKMSVTEVDRLAAELAQQPSVAAAYADRIAQVLATPDSIIQQTPNDPRFPEQWYQQYTPGTAEGMNLEAAWDVTTGSSDVVVAILDTGILPHADLVGRQIPGYDMITDPFRGNDGDGRDSDPTDPGDWILENECGGTHPARDSLWHGTIVAGVVGATANNEIGIAGVDWQASIMPVRVVGKCGSAFSDIIDAIRWSAGLPIPFVPSNPTPADVLSLSIGGVAPCFTSLQSAVDDAVAAGSVVVAGAANHGRNATIFAPANCNNVVTVASTRRTGDKPDYTNFGPLVEVSAPGGYYDEVSNGILTTSDGGVTTPNHDNSYTFFVGTSVSTPMVAGAVSLLLSQQPELTPAQVVARLQETARPFPAGSSCSTRICGAGIVDVHRLLTTIDRGRIFLPYVSNNAVFDPQPHPTPPPSNLPEILNGDFELGNNSDWSEGSSNGFALILNNNLPIVPRSGEWLAWLGGFESEQSSLNQIFSLEATSGPVFLEYHYQIHSEDRCWRDYVEVWINDTPIDTFTLCQDNKTPGWEQAKIDISNFAGEPADLLFWVTTDGEANSNLFIDDVAITNK